MAKKIATTRARVQKDLIERLKDLARAATLQAAKVELGMDVNDGGFVQKASTIDHLSKLLAVLDELKGNDT